MVEYRSERLDAVFHALADPTRREMLQALSQAAASVGDLAAPFSISLAAASKHIKVLERAGLIRREVQGRTHLCRLDAAPMHAGLEWLRHYEHYWSGRLDALEQALRVDDQHTSRRAIQAGDDQPPSRARKSPPSARRTRK